MKHIILALHDMQVTLRNIKNSNAKKAWREKVFCVLAGERRTLVNIL